MLPQAMLIFDMSSSSAISMLTTSRWTPPPCVLILVSTVVHLRIQLAADQVVPIYMIRLGVPVAGLLDHLAVFIAIICGDAIHGLADPQALGIEAVIYRAAAVRRLYGKRKGNNPSS